MSNQALPLSLGKRGDLIDPYWLHMEIKTDTPDDGMTVDEAADLVDAAYNIKACEAPAIHEVWQQGDDGSDRDIWSDVTDLTGIDADTLAAMRRFVDLLNRSGHTANCDGDKSLDDLLAYDVTIKIFRSHRDELYKLQMANGFASPAIKYSGRVVHTVDLKGKESHTFDNPLVFIPGIRPPVLSWQGFDGPPIHILGNTAYWEGEVEGSLRAEFYTEWDEVTIAVTGDASDSVMITGTDQTTYGTGWYSGSESGEEIDDYQDVECSVLGFYHYQYEELLLNRPEDDESTTDAEKAAICRFIMTMVDDPRDPGEADPEAKCQRHVTETVVCQCGGEEETNAYYEVVGCPAGVRDGATLQGTTERKIYKDCGDTDSANDPVFYEEKCCESPADAEISLPQCQKVVKKFTGTNEKNFDEADYPEGTKFVVVAPVDGQCGEHTIEQVIHAGQCCEGVPPLVWDDAESVDIMAPESSGFILVTGGRMPRTVTVRGKGFYLNSAYTQRDGFVNGELFRIYTSEDACGTCVITVTDGCSSVTGFVKSTVGHWEITGNSCPSGGSIPATSYTVTGYEDLDVYAYQDGGSVRITQSVEILVHSLGTCCADYDWRTCSSPTASCSSWDVAGCLSFEASWTDRLSGICAEDDCGGIFDCNASSYCESTMPPDGFNGAPFSKLYGAVKVEKWVC